MARFHPVFALAAGLGVSLGAAAAPASCPADPGSIHTMSDAQIQQACRNSSNALVTAEGYPNSYGAVRLCREALAMARQAGNVVYATGERQKGFVPEVPLEPNQEEAKLASARNLIRLHNYTNVSMAALYRSRLKLRKFLADVRLAEEHVSADGKYAQAKLDTDRKTHESLKIPESMDPLVLRSERDVTNLSGLLQDLQMARACLEPMKSPLDANFDEWKMVKEKLLAQSFEKFVPSLSDRAAEDVYRSAAKDLQQKQQYVHDVMTDPAKQDWAYKLAEGCQQEHCRAWAALINNGAWLTDTPVIGSIAKLIAAGEAGDLALRQGLPFWEQEKEAFNVAWPFGLGQVPTEIGAIEKGEVHAYK